MKKPMIAALLVALLVLSCAGTAMAQASESMPSYTRPQRPSGTMPEAPTDGTMPEAPTDGTMPEAPTDGTMPEAPTSDTLPQTQTSATSDDIAARIHYLAASLALLAVGLLLVKAFRAGGRRMHV